MRVSVHHVRPHNNVARLMHERGIGDFFGFGDDTTTTKGTATSAAAASSSATSEATSAATSAAVTTSATTSEKEKPTSATSTSESSTSTPTSSSTSSTVTSSSTSSTRTSNAAPPPTPTPTPVKVESTSVFVSSSGGRAMTITSVVFATDTNAVSAPASATVSSASATSSHQSTPFLQNKAASGVVFTLVALISVVVIVSIATTAIRKSRKSKLERDALEDGGINWPSPDPSAGAAGAAAPASLRHSTEKTPWNDSGSVYSHGGTPAAGPGFGSDHGHGAPAPVVPPQRSMTPGVPQSVIPPQRSMTPGVPPSVQYIQPQYTGYAPSQPPSSHGHGYYAQGPEDYAYGPPGMQQHPAMYNPYAAGYAPGPPGAFSADDGYAAGGVPQIPPPTLVVNTASVPMRRTSLVNANPPNLQTGAKSSEDPTSPTTSWEQNSNSSHASSSERVQRRTSHSRGLDPMLPPLPRSPALPETFGPRESAEEKPLRIANQ